MHTSLRRRLVAAAAGVTLLATGCAARFERPQAADTTVLADGSVVAVDPDTGLPTDQGGAPVVGPSGATGAGAGPGGGTTGPGTAPGPGATAGPGGGATSGPGTQPGPGGGGGGVATVDAGKRTGVTATTIKLCYLIPVTGAAPLPPQVQQGIRAFWRYLDDRGGIYGRKVEGEIQVFDTTSNEGQARAQAQSAIDAGCFLVAHLDRLGVQKAIGEYLNARKVPNIAVQTPANLSQSQEWTFGITIDHVVQGRMIADYFKRKLGKSKAAVVYEQDPTLNPGVAAFEEQAKKIGLDVAYKKSINQDGNDFSTQARELRESEAEAVWLYMAPVVMRKFVRQSEVNYHPTWFGNSISWNFDVSFTGDTTGDLRGARAFSPWPALGDARTATYRQAYQRAYNDPPLDLGVPGWGLGQIVSSALLNAGRDLGQNNFRHAMQNLRLARTGLVDKTPLLWSPIAFAPGVRTGSHQVITFKESNSVWTVESDYRSGY